MGHHHYQHGPAWGGNMPPWGSGPPPWVQAMFGKGFAGATGFRPPRAKRGDVRAAILDVLSGEAMNGYQIIQQIAERSGGAWKPSPGSVYPTLQQLEDEGLIRSTERDGRKQLWLTDAGREYVDSHPEEMAATWRPFAEAEEADNSDLKATIGQVAAAVWQVAVSGTPAQQEKARDILADTRRKLYGLLADGDDER